MSFCHCLLFRKSSWAVKDSHHFNFQQHEGISD